MSLANALKKAASASLKKLGGDVTIRQVTAGAYNTTTGAITESTSDTTIKGALSNVRQSNTKIAKNYFSESNTYYQNRNLIFNKKETNFLDKEESLKLYGKYDKQEFYIRNTNTKDYLGNCSVAYFKPSNVHYAVQGAVTASDKITREKYNNTYFCETIVPLNTFYHGKSKVDTKRIYKKCKITNFKSFSL